MFTTILPLETARLLYPFHFELKEKWESRGLSSRAEIPTKFFGYWSEEPNKPYGLEKILLPWPGDFIEPGMSFEERQKTSLLLGETSQAMRYLGYSWDRLNPDKPCIRGSRDFILGPYQWPEGLSHYVLTYGLKIDPKILTDLQKIRITLNG